MQPTSAVEYMGKERVLASSSLCKLESSESRKSQLRRCLHKLQPGDIFLVMTGEGPVHGGWWSWVL